MIGIFLFHIYTGMSKAVLYIANMNMREWIMIIEEVSPQQVSDSSVTVSTIKEDTGSTEEEIEWSAPSHTCSP
jgi:hypothetical protein